MDGRSRRHDPGQRRALAGAGGLEHEVPLSASSTLPTPAATSSPSAAGDALRPGRQRRGLLGARSATARSLIAQARTLRRGHRFLRVRGRHEVTLRTAWARDGPRDVMRFRVTHGENDESAVPATLGYAEFDGLTESGAGAHARVSLPRGATREGRCGYQRRTVRPERMAATSELGSTEIWQISAPARTRSTSTSVHFKVLSRNGRQPGPPTPAGRTPWISPQARKPGARPVRRLQGPVRLPLPQPRARGHDDDGQLRSDEGQSCEPSKRSPNRPADMLEQPRTND